MPQNEAKSQRIPFQCSLKGRYKPSIFMTVVAFLHVKRLHISTLAFFIVCITVKLKARFENLQMLLVRGSN